MADPNPNASVESDSDEGLRVFPPDNKFPPGLICPFCGRNQTKKVSNPRVRCRRCDAHLGMVDSSLARWEGVKQQRRRRRGKAQPPASSSTTTTDDELHQQQEVEESSGVMEDEDESIGVMEKLQMEDEDDYIYQE